MSREGRCPKCGEWSPVAWQDEIPPGGTWWVDSDVCPKCGATILVESECDFRETVDVESKTEITVTRPGSYNTFTRRELEQQAYGAGWRRLVWVQRIDANGMYFGHLYGEKKP